MRTKISLPLVLCIFEQFKFYSSVPQVKCISRIAEGFHLPRQPVTGIGYGINYTIVQLYYGHHFFNGDGFLNEQT